MKVENCIAVAEDLLKEVDECIEDGGDRSEFVEAALRNHIAQVKWKKNRKMSREEEIKILNQIADEQREEILETLEYQIDW